MSVLQKFGVPLDTTDGHQTLMPKLQYRFRVLFGNLGGDPENKIITRQVISVTRPQLTHDEMILDVYNSRIYLAGKHTWAPITVIIRDEINSETIKKLDQQLQNQLDHYEQSSAAAGSNYKFYMGIETLDGSSVPGKDTKHILDHWHLEGCYISDIQYGESNYSTSDVQQVTCIIRYDNAAHGAGDFAEDGDTAYLRQTPITGATSGNATGSNIATTTSGGGSGAF